MPTSFDTQYRIYCYQYCKFFWVGWIESTKLHQEPLYFDNTKTVMMFPETWLDHVTFGFTRYSVMKKLRKRYEKFENLH